MESEAKVGQTEKRNEAMKKGQKERMKDGKLEKERKKESKVRETWVVENPAKPLAFHCVERITCELPLWLR